MEKRALAPDQMMHVQNLGKVVSCRLREDGKCHGGLRLCWGFHVLEDASNVSL